MRSLTKNIKVLVATILTIIIAFIFLDIFNGQFSFSENQKIENLISEKEKDQNVVVITQPDE